MPNKPIKKKQKLIFVVNPISGDLDKDIVEDHIRRYAEQEDFWAHVYYTTGESDDAAIRELIKKIEPDKVVAAGGDGTCNMVGKLLLNSPIKMGILPVGSANGLATELCIPNKIKEALKTVVHGIVKAIDVIRVNGNYISLHLSDIGLNANAVQRFQKDTVRGFWGYGKHLMGELMAAKPLKFKIVIDGQEILKSAYMVVLANASQYGTGAKINPKGKLDDGVFEIVLVRAYSIRHLLGMIVPLFTKTIHQLDYIDVYSCKSVRIETPKKEIVQVDGEVIGSMNVINANILENALQVMVP